MYTPRRPVKRRLFTTPFTPFKRPRSTWAGANQGINRFQALNRRTAAAPSTRGTLAQQVKSLQRVVKALAPEVKYSDDSIATGNIPVIGSVTLLSSIAQGDTGATRTGNTISVKEVSIFGILQRNATDFAADAYLRVAVVVDKQNVADTAPLAADIFADAGQPWVDAPNVANLERFRILYMSPLIDMWRVRADSDHLAASTPTQAAHFQFTKKMNLKVSYNGAANTDIEENGVYLVLLSNVATADITGLRRIAFTDV